MAEVEVPRIRDRRGQYAGAGRTQCGHARQTLVDEFALVMKGQGRLRYGAVAGTIGSSLRRASSGSRRPSLGRHQGKLRSIAPNRIAELGAGADKRIARVNQHLHWLLLHRLHRHEPLLRPGTAHRFANGFPIGGAVLAAALGVVYKTAFCNTR
jgi:hypothetical protein